MYSEFLNHYFLYDIKAKTGHWINEIIYYAGDMSNVDLADDWRFKRVPGKRDQLIFLGIKQIDFKEIEIDWTKESI